MNMKTKLFAAALALVSFAGPLAQVAVAVETRISVQQLDKDGETPSYTSSGLLTTTTYKVRNDGKLTFLHFKKTGAGDCTVTLTTPATNNGVAVADVTVTVVATSGDKMVGPLPAGLFNDANSDVSFTISDTVGLSIGVFKL